LISLLPEGDESCSATTASCWASGSSGTFTTQSFEPQPTLLQERDLPAGYLPSAKKGSFLRPSPLHPPGIGPPLNPGPLRDLFRQPLWNTPSSRELSRSPSPRTRTNEKTKALRRKPANASTSLPGYQGELGQLRPAETPENASPVPSRPSSRERAPYTYTRPPSISEDRP
jgi:hypothetical protein